LTWLAQYFLKNIKTILKNVLDLKVFYLSPMYDLINNQKKNNVFLVIRKEKKTLTIKEISHKKIR
jgi:hypothetical protein